VSKNGLFAMPFIYKMHHFTKTGSGQTQGKLKKRGVFPQALHSRAETAFKRHFHTKKLNIAKTGSGQTQEKLSKKSTVFPMIAGD
jgi:hypothetical protein